MLLSPPVKSLLQDVSFFDLDENTSGAMSSRLSVDTASIRGAVGDQLGLLAQNLVTFLTGYIIAFINGCVPPLTAGLHCVGQSMAA